MDAMKPRSKEALAKQKEKAGCANLKDQIPHMEMYNILPTPASQEPGFVIENRNPVDKNGAPVTHHNQRWYDPTTGRLMQKGLSHAISILPTIGGASKKGGGIDALGGGSQGRKKCIEIFNQTLGGRDGWKLQPGFVEWMMGFPPGWTDIGPQD
jgi:hypothetical protein